MQAKTINWPAPWLQPIYLGNAPDDLRGLPDADCERCKYRGQYEDQHCYMLQDHPGPKCGQFRAGG